APARPIVVAGHVEGAGGDPAGGCEELRLRRVQAARIDLDRDVARAAQVDDEGADVVGLQAEYLLRRQGVGAQLPGVGAELEGMGRDRLEVEYRDAALVLC